MSSLLSAFYFEKCLDCFSLSEPGRTGVSGVHAKQLSMPPSNTTALSLEL